MTARPGPGTPGLVVSATDHRRALGAFMAPGSSSDPLVTRSGVVPAPGNPLRVSQNSPLGMTALVQPGNAEVHRTGRGPYTPYNDAVATVAFDVAPATNSRYDLVCLSQNDSEADANSLSTLGVLKGTALPVPARPYDLVPAGGIVLAEVGPIAVGTTQITNAMIANVARFAAVRGTPIWVRNLAERDELTPLASATFPITVERLDTGAIERNRGSGWDVLVGSDVGTATPQSGWTFGGSVLRKTNGIVTWAFQITKSTAIVNDDVVATLPVGFRPITNIYGAGLLYGSGSPGGFMIAASGQVRAYTAGLTSMTVLGGSSAFAAA